MDINNKNFTSKLDKQKQECIDNIESTKKLLLDKLSHEILNLKTTLTKLIEKTSEQILNKIADDLLELKLELNSSIQIGDKDTMDKVDTMFMEHENKVDKLIDEIQQILYQFKTEITSSQEVLNQAKKVLSNFIMLFDH